MPQSLVGNWNYPTSIRFGAGRIRELPDACKAIGLQRPLLVTDPGLASLPNVTFTPGGVTIMAGDVPIGGIGVGGAPGGNFDDDCARAGLAKIKDRMK